MTKQTKRYPGKIDRLPRAFQDLVGRLLAEGWTKTAITDALNAELAAAGKAPVSRGSVNRYTARVQAGGQKMREASEAAKAWAQTTGQVDGGEIDAYLVNLVRTLALDHIHLFEAASAGADAPSIQDVSQLALALRRLIDSQEKADKRIERKLAAAADEISETLQAEGASESSIERMRRIVLGSPAS